MNLSETKCPIGVPFGHAVCVALEEIARMQAINDGADGEEPSDWQIRRLLGKAESDLIEVQRLARGGSPSGLHKQLPVEPKLICKTCGTSFTGYHDCGGLI